MRIVIRFDDICPTMDWEQWEKATAVMDQYGVKPLIGVIPEVHDPELDIDPPREDYWEYLHQLQNKGYTIAMHGVYHKYIPGRRTEFAGVPYEQQLEMIRTGREILNSHGIETDIFFAPSHSYDNNTLKALAACGFRYLSDGKSRKPYIQEGIICVPCRATGVPKIKNSSKNYMAVFHAHEWVRPDKQEGYPQLKQICSKYTDSIVSFQDYMSMPIGNYYIQKANEQWFLFYRKYWAIPFMKHVRIPLGKVKRAVLKRIK